jgi:hypothetical protein
VHLVWTDGGGYCAWKQGADLVQVKPKQTRINVTKKARFPEYVPTHWDSKQPHLTIADGWVVPSRGRVIFEDESGSMEPIRIGVRMEQVQSELRPVVTSVTLPVVPRTRDLLPADADESEWGNFAPITSEDLRLAALYLPRLVPMAVTVLALDATFTPERVEAAVNLSDFDELQDSVARALRKGPPGKSKIERALHLLHVWETYYRPRGISQKEAGLAEGYSESTIYPYFTLARKERASRSRTKGKKR